jgi:protein-S-isoprenylcysteine O-methyltransferase Ste14
MACTMVAIPFWPMWLVGAIHIAMILTKAASEERYLRQLHGVSYEQYCRATDRFLPRRYLQARFCLIRLGTKSGI